MRPPLDPFSPRGGENACSFLGTVVQGMCQGRGGGAARGSTGCARASMRDGAFELAQQIIHVEGFGNTGARAKLVGRLTRARIRRKNDDGELGAPSAPAQLLDEFLAI